MGFFDIFKKKQDNAAADIPESGQQQQEELSAGLEKTKTGIFSKLARRRSRPLDGRCRRAGRRGGGADYVGRGRGNHGEDYPGASKSAWRATNI